VTTTLRAGLHRARGPLVTGDCPAPIDEAQFTHLVPILSEEVAQMPKVSASAEETPPG
jgi:hypothetical protein